MYISKLETGSMLRNSGSNQRRGDMLSDKDDIYLR